MLGKLPFFLKSGYFSFLFICTHFLAFSQVGMGVLKSNPVKWSFSAKVISGNEAEIAFTARIDSGWHIFSQLPNESGLGTPTKFIFVPSGNFELIGSAIEPEPIKHRDTILDAEMQYFEKEVSFRQKIKIKGTGAFQIKGNIESSACNESGCLPPEIKEFSIQIESEKSPADSSSTGVGGGCGLWWKIFLLGFLGGIAALLTPCVFPMVPLTVSFFTKQSKDRKRGIRNAGLYAFNIIFIYVFLGFLITVTLGADALNALSANEWMNLLFFIIFIIFGISFLGAFEITLPSRWINKADKASEKGGFVGIFFMAFTLALVSFSCTGPIMGSLLVEASRGGVFCPLVGMLGFSMALALPFFFFAAFPSWLNTLPKSGGWLNNVKVVLGLLEIAFAFKFLSVTDLQGFHIAFLDFHINGPLGILKREIFIAIWITLFSLIGFYLLGGFRTAHDSENKHVSTSKLMFAILSFSFTIYMIPGLWGAPLKLISGFLPPSFYSEGWTAGSGSMVVAGNKEGSDHVSKNCPHNLDCFHDYDEAMAYAKKTNKPLLVDFTGWSCVNCRKMEVNVWSNEAVLSRIKNEFVLVSLYVDDRNGLPEDKQYISETSKKKITMYGSKWSDYQEARYSVLTQPLYAIQDHNGRDLAPPRGYDLDIDAYINFLDKGLEEFKKK